MEIYEKVMKISAWKSEREIGHKFPELVTAVRSKFKNLKKMLVVHPELSGTAILEFPGTGGRIFLTRTFYDIHILNDWSQAMMLLIDTSFTTLDLQRLPVYKNVTLLTRDTDPWNLQQDIRQKIRQNSNTTITRTEEGLLSVEETEIRIIDRMADDLETKQTMLSSSLEVVFGLEPGHLTSDQFPVKPENYEEDLNDNFERKL